MTIIDQMKRIESGKKELRSFGIVMAVALAIIGGILLWNESRYYVHIFGIGAAFLVLGLAVPILLWPIHKVWMSLAIVLGWVMTRLILAVLFYLVFTPIGLVARIFGKKFINTAVDREADSYWIVKEKLSIDKADYEKQF
ncbi:MAG: hypothetical protein JSU74_00635 [Candidatus Zixiibacteriota bacterium]|nr:MAG: hypothetical protein JSU74_00635 [candidate division Zixibacteria bacterium]